MPLTAQPRTFDHAVYAELPEYHRLREALSDFLNAAGGEATVEDVADMTRTSYAGDFCPCCEGYERTCWPFAASVKDGWMVAHYRCPRTGHVWTCGWTADLEIIAAMP